MYWQDRPTETPTVPDNVVDVVFSFSCRALPVEHAHVLWSEIAKTLPWIAQEPGAGIHPVHVADSGNGWMRPDQPDQLLYPSRRTKLALRVPKHRVAEAQALTGKTLDLAGNLLTVQKASVRPLSAITTIFSRYVVLANTADEAGFLAEALAQLRALGVAPSKMLCGREHVIATPERAVRARSLMLAELTFAESIVLQQHGLGPLRHLGCGLFIPHKDIKELGAAAG